MLTMAAAATALVMYRVALSHRPATEAIASARVKESALALNAAIDRDLAERYIGIQQLARDIAAQNRWNWGKTDEKSPLISAINRYVGMSGDSLSMLVGIDGKPLAINTRTNGGEALDTTTLYDQNFAEALWFTAARDGVFLNGANGLTGTAVIGPYNDKSLAELLGNDGLALAFSTPVKDDAGKLLGIWVNFLPFSAIEQLIASHHHQLRADGLARTSIMLLDSKGVVLVDFDPAQGDYKRNYSVIGKLNLLEAGVEAAAKAINDHQSGVTTAALAHRPVLVDGYSYSSGWGNYPGLGWTVLVRADSDELFAHRTTEKTLKEVALVLVIGTFLLGLIASWMVRQPAPAASVVTPQPSAEIVPLPIAEKKAEKKEKKSGTRHALAETLLPEMQSSLADITTAATELRREIERLMPLAQETKRRSGLINGSLSHAAMAASQADSTMAEFTSTSSALEKQIAAEKPLPLATLNEAMQALMATSEQLQHAAPFISKLAAQVNLLSLNATIEAARAGGESGESLATLASELKTLAAEATSATENLSSKLASSHNVSAEALTALRDAMLAVEATSARHAEVPLTQQREVASKLARNIGNASSNLREAGEIVGTVEQGAEETAAAIKQLQTSTATLHRHLAALGEKLEGWMSKYTAA